MAIPIDHFCWYLRRVAAAAEHGSALRPLAFTLTEAVEARGLTPLTVRSHIRVLREAHEIELAVVDLPDLGPCAVLVVGEEATTRTALLTSGREYPVVGRWGAGVLVRTGNGVRYKGPRDILAIRTVVPTTFNEPQHDEEYAPLLLSSNGGTT